MIRLPFLPRFFPVLLLPLWWVFLLCFYSFYLPLMLLTWIFSPWSPRKSESDPYRKRTRDIKRSMESDREKKTDSPEEGK